MKLTSLLSALTAMALASTVSSVGSASAADVTLSATPPLVQASILQLQRGGELKEIEAKTAEGQTWYEAYVELPNNRDLQIHVRPDGSIIRTLEEIAHEELPTPVQVTLAQAAPTGKVEKATRVITNGITMSYRVEVDREEGDDVIMDIADNGLVLSSIKE